MLKKIHLILFSVLAHSLVQASFYEKMSSFGTEVGKKITQYPVTSIAAIVIVANTLPFYYRQKAVRFKKEAQVVFDKKELTPQEKQTEYGTLHRKSKYYLSKFQNIRNKVISATSLLPMAYVLHWSLMEEYRARAVFPKAMLATMVLYKLFESIPIPAAEEAMEEEIQ